MSKKNTILLTGGHLAPLLAVLEVLREKAECVVVGRKYSFEKDKAVALEHDIIKELGIPFYVLHAARLQRRLSSQTLPSLARSPFSYLKSIKILKKVKPGVVLTFGGYIGVPVALAAYSLKIPVVLHEQTHRAGLANKLISKVAVKICVSYPSSEKYFPQDKVVVTGNPVRKEVFTVDKTFDIPKNLPVLFVTGGSTGAHTINTYIEYLLNTLLETFVVIHQTGDSHEYKDFDRLSMQRKKLPEDLKKRYILKKFILPSEIGFVYSAANVVLGRSGANTVAELLALQKHALLVPLPHGQANEQLLNAQYYASSGLGEYQEEKDIELGSLIQELASLVSRKASYHSKNVYKKDAAEQIAEIVLNSIKNG